MFMAALQHPIREAERYLLNARQMLTDKAEKDGDYYNDTKNLTSSNVFIPFCSCNGI